MCEALRDALPDRYGISRGYAVEERGRTAGDDVIIFERGRFPTLALRRRDDFARKEFIPIEAVYSYIEAKHTLELTGNGPQSLHHACEQVSQVKELCGQRERLGPDQIAPYQKVGFSIQGTTSPDFPEIVNPVLGVVFARRVRHSAGSPLLDNPVEINSFLAEHKISTKEKPDLIVLGDNNLIVPTLPAPTPGQHLLRSPFFIQHRSAYHACMVEGVAFGIAFLSIMSALDWIQLGVMPWHRIIVDGLGIPYERRESS